MVLSHIFPARLCCGLGHFTTPARMLACSLASIRLLSALAVVTGKEEELQEELQASRDCSDPLLRHALAIYLLVQVARTSSGIIQCRKCMLRVMLHRSDHGRC